MIRLSANSEFMRKALKKKLTYKIHDIVCDNCLYNHTSNFKGCKNKKCIKYTHQPEIEWGWEYNIINKIYFIKYD